MNKIPKIISTITGLTLILSVSACGCAYDGAGTIGDKYING
jgi:hypothetical protein